MSASDRPRAWNSSLPVPSKRLGRNVPLNPINRERRKTEVERAYGPAERRAWVKTLPCIVCGRRPCDNAHVKGGGTGRKADAEWIVPLCMPWMDEQGIREGHHREQHRKGQETFQRKYGIDLALEAGKIEGLWQERQG